MQSSIFVFRDFGDDLVGEQNETLMSHENDNGVSDFTTRVIHETGSQLTRLRIIKNVVAFMFIIKEIYNHRDSLTSGLYRRSRGSAEPSLQRNPPVFDVLVQRTRLERNW